MARASCTVARRLDGAWKDRAEPPLPRKGQGEMKGRAERKAPESEAACSCCLGKEPSSSLQLWDLTPLESSQGELTIPTTPLMATASSANTCPPDKISSAFFCLARQQKGFPLWFFPTAVLNPQPRAALCQAVWQAGVLEVHQLKPMLAQMSWWALGYCRAFASSRPHNCWFLCLWERLA